ncbi:hemerythrin [Mycobacterium sp. E136]|uniref:hemerythrin domain-containing protein n=1 Tax=Mycobacterium sp. E136 TaxID=1834125 RepID=UPI0007FC9A74|nr:hemerythrin domain-containing protein [Mycobacterium sp. E136]OBG85650.1 hemerythrin [Mycobacterium sp. E136]
MCQYCGCRDLPLIRDYIAEHAHVLNLGGEAVRRIDRGDLDTARRLLAEMAEALESHWRGEEEGLFKVLQGEELFAEHIEPLIREHRELADLLASVDLAREADQQAVRVAVEDLWEHTRKEEDGIFPASLTELDGEDWDAAIAAWHAAHPDREMVKWGV